jgi:hypothetical protein
MKLIALSAVMLSLAALSAWPHATQSLPQADSTRVREIAPGQSHRWTIQHRASRLEGLGLLAGRARGLQMYLYDAEGELKAVDEDARDGLGLALSDRWQGPFTLVVKNASREANVYKLMVK